MVLLLPQLILLILCLGLPSVSPECLYRECTCSAESVNCESIKLNQLPTPVYLSGDHQSLFLDFNNITEIPAGSLPSNLTGIELIHNPVTTIADTAFNGSVFTLQALSFSFAQFTRIPNAFHSLKNLQYLTIQDTNIEDWNEEAMMNVGQTLVKLDLGNVGLKSWPSWIQNFSHLADLTLARGSLQYIPDDAFDKLATSLNSLSLVKNNLTSIPKALSQLSALNSLNLENNNIIDITWLPQGSKLSILWLNYNAISNSQILGEALRRFGGSLVDFDIRFNKLTNIPDCSSMTRISNLDLSHNRISDPYSGSVLPTIYSLDMSYNLLPVIPRLVSTLQQATNLNLAWNLITAIIETDIAPTATSLDLGNNLITELTDNSFPNTSQLVSLQLNHNPIVKISSMAFKNLVLLIELNLRGTRLTRLPLALGSLTGLKQLDMSGCTNLICTCLEKGLAPWVTALLPNQVVGTCGELSVYSFFKELSPYCPTE